MAGDDRALIVIDVQNDFCPGGALAVAEGDLVVAAINRVAGGFPVKVLTQDWHPPHHRSFAANHPDAEPFSTVEMPYGPQVLWPVHCVQGTRRGGVPSRPRDRRRRPDPAQGVPRRDRQLLGLLRERPDDADRARRLPARARGPAAVAGRAGDRLLRRLFGDRRGGRGLRGDGARGRDCRAIDLDGSLAAAMREMAGRGVGFARAEDLPAG